jgi:hypothetical protein
MMAYLGVKKLSKWLYGTDKSQGFLGLARPAEWWCD